jgi:hypothetical protein
MVSDIPVGHGKIANLFLQFGYKLQWLVTSRLGTGKSLTFFTVYTKSGSPTYEQTSSRSCLRALKRSQDPNCAAYYIAVFKLFDT